LKKVIVGCVGSDDLAVIQRHARKHEVVAVVFDLGEAAGMRDVHDQARAAGAARCHVLDVRDEYIRTCVLPALSDGGVADRARTFLAEKLAEVAAFEGPCRVVAPAELAARPARAPHGAVDCAAVVAILFEDRVPVAVNDIPMTLSEVMECLTTIGDVHRIAPLQPALHILQAANRQLESRSSGVARLELSAGSIRA
jgi:argininosuccinate synthase